MNPGLELVLQEEKVVSGSNCDDIFCRVPCCMEDLLLEVKAVHEYLILFALATRADLSWFQDGFGLRNLFGGFISDFFAGRTVKHAEEIVVRASHDGSIIAIPTALKLIKDAIVFVQRAQLGSQILMNSVGLDGLGLHMKVPNFDGQIVAGDHVSSRVGEFDVRYG